MTEKEKKIYDRIVANNNELLKRVRDSYEVYKRMMSSESLKKGKDFFEKSLISCEEEIARLENSIPNPEYIAWRVSGMQGEMPPDKILKQDIHKDKAA